MSASEGPSPVHGSHVSSGELLGIVAAAIVVGAGVAAATMRGVSLGSDKSGRSCGFVTTPHIPSSLCSAKSKSLIL